MITIIHGDDIVASREAFSQLKKASKECIELDLNTITLEKLKQELEGTGLFAEDKVVVVESLLTSAASSSNKEIIAYLTKEDSHLNIILWEGKDANAKVLQKFASAKVLYFKLKRTIFAFLDSIRPGNGKTSMVLFYETLKHTEAEVVFFMLVRHFRLMLAILDNSKAILDNSKAILENSKIDEVKNMASWQQSKLKKQANIIGKERLLTLYKKLFEIEISQKTGNLQLTLAAVLDLFLLEV